MAMPDPSERGNPFQFLLGDLMKVIGSGGDQWEMSRSFALQVATDGVPEPNVDPVARIRLEELARVAELHVVEATGMPVSHDGRRITCVPVGRGGWALRALEAWRPVLSSMAPPPPAPGATPPLGDLGGLGEDEGEGGMAALLGQWAAAIGPMLFGLQVGSVVGHLAQRALGQYVLPISWPPSDELLVITANVDAFAADWSLPAEEALLWTCARELAAHTVLSRPHLRAHLDELLGAVARSAAATQQGLLDRLGSLGGGGMDPEAIQGLLGDPDALLSDLLTPESRQPSDRLTAMGIVIAAYADHVATSVGDSLVGSHAQLAEAWHRRQLERGKGEEAAGTLFGLDLGPDQVDRGRAFIAGVVERAGEDGLERLWSHERNLPTPAEVDAPGLWLERISLPELDEPGDA